MFETFFFPNCSFRQHNLQTRQNLTTALTCVPYISCWEMRCGLAVRKGSCSQRRVTIWFYVSSLSQHATLLECSVCDSSLIPQNAIILNACLSFADPLWGWRAITADSFPPPPKNRRFPEELNLLSGIFSVCSKRLIIGRGYWITLSLVLCICFRIYRSRESRATSLVSDQVTWRYIVYVIWGRRLLFIWILKC